jgi:hypothetical protein
LRERRQEAGAPVQGTLGVPADRPQRAVARMAPLA